MHKNSYATNNSRLYTTNMFSLKQQTKILLMCNSLCSRAEILGNLKIVPLTKLLDLIVLFLSNWPINMRHLCVRGVNSSSWHVSFSLLFTRNFIQQTRAAQIGKLKCYLYVIRLALKRLPLSIQYSQNSQTLFRTLFFILVIYTSAKFTKPQMV